MGTKSYFGILWYGKQATQILWKSSVLVTTVLSTGVTTYDPKRDDIDPGSPRILLQGQRFTPVQNFCLSYELAHFFEARDVLLLSNVLS